MKVTLTVIKGHHKGKAFEFRNRNCFLVGRAPDVEFRLPLKDRLLSRYHFLVEVCPPLCRIMDMASLNHTFVNGRQVETADLKDGDEILVGTTVLKVSIDARADPATVQLPDEPSAPPETTPAYELQEELGQGSLGISYRARRIADGAVCVLKVIQPLLNDTDSEIEVRRFLREAQLLRTLNHPNIVRYEAMGRLGDRLFFAMEYVPGVSARDLLLQLGAPLPIGRAVDMVCQLLDGLAYAHNRGIVHRDVKPANMMVTSLEGREVVKLTDFGLARIYQTTSLGGLTLTGKGADNPAPLWFVAPEQICDFRLATAAGDQYASAATLFHLLTGRCHREYLERIDHQMKLPDLLNKIVDNKFQPLRDRCPELPASLVATLQQALGTRPQDRFATTRAFREALQPFQNAK